MAIANISLGFDGIPTKVKIMMNIKSLSLMLILFFSMTVPVNAAIYKDVSYNFQIQVSDDWKTKKYSDGPDRLYDMMSPDENVLVRVRAIRLTKPLPIELLRKIYEQEYLKGASLYKEEDTLLNGINGKSFFYHWEYNGHQMNVVSWFAVLPKMAFIVTRIVPEMLLETRGTEAVRIIQTFQSSLSGIASVKSTAKPVPKKQAPAPAKTVSEITLKLDRSIFKPNHKIAVTFSGLPAKGQDWLALSDINHKPDEYFDMVMLEGRPQSGSHSFKGLPEGKYEVRVYTDWPDGGYTVAAKASIRVSKLPAAPKAPINLAQPPKKPVPPAPAKPKPASPGSVKAKPVPAESPVQATIIRKQSEVKPGLSTAAVPARPADTPLLAHVAVGTGWDGVAFIDKKGREVLGPGIRFRNNKFTNGYIIAFKDGKDRLFHRTGSVVPSEHKILSTFSDGLAAVKMNTGYNFITEEGTTVFKKSFRNVKSFSQGLAPVKAEEPKGSAARWGYINTSGAFVIKPQFEDASLFKSNIAFIKNREGRWAMINASGKLLTGFNFAGFSEPINHLSRVSFFPHGTGQTLLSMNGADKLGQSYKSISPVYENNKTFAGWKVTDKTGASGLLDDSGHPIIPPGQIERIGKIGDGFIIAQKDKQGPVGYMDMRGNWVIEPQYYRAHPFSEDRAFVQPERNGPVQMIDKSGKIVKKYPGFNMLLFFGDFMEGLAVVVDQKNGYKLGYVDSLGEWAIKPIFNGDVVNDQPNRAGFKFGLAPACKLQKGQRQCGFIDTSGTWIINPTFIGLPKHFQ